MSGLPDWLVAHLTDSGRANPDGVSRNARLNQCHDCFRPVITGLDGDLCAAPVTCDPHEIDTNGELVALALNLNTYTLTRATTSSGKSTWNLDPRDPLAIAAGRRTAVVAQHRCGIAIPPARESLLPGWMTPKTYTEPDF